MFKRLGSILFSFLIFSHIALGGSLLNSYISFPDSGGSFSPSDIANLEAWYDATDVTTNAEPSDNDNIANWQDLSTNGYDLAQGTGTQQPTYKTNIQNGKPAVLFDDASQEFLHVDTSAISQPITICMAYKQDANPNPAYFIDGKSERCGIRTTDVGGTDRYQVLTGPTTNLKTYSTTTVDTNAHYGIFLFDGSSSTADIDGTNYGTVSLGTNGLTGIVLGGSTGLSGSYSGYMFEVIIYSKALTASELSDIETYFADKWGI